MAKNPKYLKLHSEFCAWLERERAGMTTDVQRAADQFRCVLWSAAVNRDPPNDIDSEMSVWSRAYGEFRDRVNRMPDALPSGDHRH